MHYHGQQHYIYILYMILLYSFSEVRENGQDTIVYINVYTTPPPRRISQAKTLGGEVHTYKVLL